MSERDLNRRLATLGSLYTLARSLQKAQPAVGRIREPREAWARPGKSGKEK